VDEMDAYTDVGLLAETSDLLPCLVIPDNDSLVCTGGYQESVVYPG
jgi:hypothetical protein